MMHILELEGILEKILQKPEYGAATKSRTRDLLITSQLLYQLSYCGVERRALYSSFFLVQPFFYN